VRPTRSLAAAGLALAAFAVACETTVNLGNGPDGGGGDGAATGVDAASDVASSVDAASADGGGSGSDGGGTSDTGTPDVTPVDAGPKGIFITRATYFPDWGGIANADFRCQSSAKAAQLGGTWKAWMSDSGHDAADRILSDGPWLAAVTGVTLFQNHANLRGFPLAAITTDELGKPAPDRWWTGTLANGVRSTKTCNDWASRDQFQGAQTGALKGTGVPGKEWTEDDVFSCQDTFALLCLQD
jgi:hypothetical protein